MKILFFTDPHFCQYSSIVRSRGEKYSSRLECLVKSLNFVEELSYDYGCDEVVCGGDFFDESELNAEEITALSEIHWNCLPHTFIVGNHEIAAYDDSISSAHLFNMADCEVIDKPTIRGNIMFLPYQLEDNRKTIKEYCEEFGAIKPIIFSHNDIAGIQYGGFKSVNGFDLNDIIDNSSLFINGHLHNGEWIVENKVLNLGNLVGQNFSEDGFNHKHQVAIIDTNTLEVNLIDNPYAYYFYKIDFTERNDIDYINEISAKLHNNAVVSILCNEADSEYIRARFDPKFEHKTFPKNCNVIESRIQINRNVKVNEENVEEIKLNDIDHIKKFQEYILSNIGNDEIILLELEEVAK